MTDAELDAAYPAVKCDQADCWTMVPPSQHNWRCEEHRSVERPTRDRMVDRATAIAAVADLPGLLPVARRVLTRVAEQHPNTVWWAIHDATRTP
jgi:hypothetical protein